MPEEESLKRKRDDSQEDKDQDPDQLAAKKKIVEALPQLKREGDGYYAEVRFLSARSPFFD
jgi:hypothetical protein